jgi:Fic-DOC domain mobile mystery protein B
VSLFEEADEHATPLGPDDRLGLKLSDITFRHELNEAEFDNIAKGERWAWRQHGDILTEDFANKLHQRMYGEVWTWAGRYSRARNRRIGADAHLIPVELRQALEDAKAWCDYESYPVDAIGVRVHWRLVTVHPYPNGNGRWSRLMADLLIRRLGAERFTWGSGGHTQVLTDATEIRRKYIASLHKADQHDFADLIAFARS